MLSFFRRALGSWVVLAILAVVLIAFIVTGIGAPIGLGGGGPSGDSVATVGGKQVPAADVAQRIQSQYQQARGQQADITMPAFLGLAGGIDAVVDQYLTGRMLEAWAARAGLVVSDRLVDAQIAQIPAFRGINGQFDERQMQSLLAQQRMTLDGLRTGLRNDFLRRSLIVPIGAAATPGQGFATPYAGIIVARREGQVGLVPFKPEAVPAPTPADVATWYKGHAARYALPERRTIRYALVDLNSVPAPTPTDAAVEAKYKADAARYAASEKRTLQQVVLPDEGAARAFATKVAGGTPFAKAAADAGFDAASISLGQLAKADFAAAAAPAIADAAFALKQGGTTAPLRSPLGWHVVHVEAIATTPARSLAEARGEILGDLVKQAKTDALNKAIQKIDDALGNGASFDDVVKANGLTVITTPPVTAAGVAPTLPDFHADATLTALLKPAFLAAPEDAPTLETVGADGQSALLGLASVQPAAPLPLDQVRGKAVADLTFFRAAQAAKMVAIAIKAKVDGGTPLAAALAAAGYAAPQPLAVSQLELRGAREVPAPLRALFTLAPGKTALAADNKGLFVVHLDRIDAPAPALVAPIAGQIRADLGRSIGDEYIEQFANAARRDVPVRKNPVAIQALGRQLSGRAPVDAAP